MRVLTVNPGSSSLKMSIVADEIDVFNTEISAERSAQNVMKELNSAILKVGSVDAAALRIVHGGDEFTDHTVVDSNVVERIASLTTLAPLHMSRSLQILNTMQNILPTTPIVACFDTVFHRNMPDAARTYALPTQWRKQWPQLHRFGFHGISHAYASHRAAELLQRPISELRTVTCHLGSGSSLAAVDKGKSVDTTMGFTPLEGPPMATRSGTVDPGLLIWLLSECDLSVQEVSSALESNAGLLALSEHSARFEEIETRARSGDSHAKLAIDTLVHHVRQLIGAMAASMSGLDCLVFTGGIGENSEQVHRKVSAGLEFMGIKLMDNNETNGDRDISTAHAQTRVLVIHAREDLEMSRAVSRLLG